MLVCSDIQRSVKEHIVRQGLRKVLVKRKQAPSEPFVPYFCATPLHVLGTGDRAVKPPSVMTKRVISQ